MIVNRSKAPGRLVSRAFEIVRSQPVATGILAVVSIAALVFSFLIGLNIIVPLVLLGVVGVGAVVLLWLWAGWRARGGEPSRSLGRWAGVLAVAMSGLLTLLLIQLVPYGRAHSNPPVTGEPKWANAQTRELMVNACFACHSNEVDYPPYASIAPISWAVQHHVDEGREKVNYSEFATHPGEAKNSIEVIEEGSMPPSYFTRFGLHPAANLTDAQEQQLIDGLRATPGLNEGR